MNDPEICARCAQQSPTCCRIPPGREDTCFPLSAAERKILEAHSPKAPGPSFAQSENSRIFQRELRRLFPRDQGVIARLFPLRHAHDRLALTTEGACVFLGPAGCLLPVEDRPLYCRLYPFWFVGRRLTGFASPTCLAVQSGSAPEDWLPLFDAAPAALWRTYARLRVAWGLPETSHQDP